MRKSRSGDDEERSIPKIVILVTSLVFVFMSTSVILAAYPQHIYIDSKTIIDSTVGFKDNKTVNIRGNIVQYGENSIIPINGQEYIRITGNQVQMGNNLFTPGIRQITANFYQNVLFQQTAGEFAINRAAQIGIDSDVIALIPVSQNIIKIKSSTSDYNVELIQDVSFIKTKNGVMLKLQKVDNKIVVSVIGLKNYDNVWMRVV